jgi:hypothetical protein
MTDKNLPSIEYLHKRLRYEPETGKLFWRDCEEARGPGPASPNKEAFTALDGTRHRHGCIDGRKFKAHRVIWALYHGEWPRDMIDHINGIRTDNRIKNLRDVSNQENQRNASMRCNNTSGICGVHWDKRTKSWRATVKVDGQKKHLGRFSDIKDAASARAEASRQYGFTDRHGT